MTERDPPPGDEPQAYVFDLGGTLLAVEDDEIALDPQGRVRPLPGVAVRLRGLAGRPVFVVSNQAGVARGSITAKQAYRFVQELDAACGGAITDFRLAMHPPEANHDWRKPKPGMLRDLAQVHGLDLSRCVMVGDSESDRRCAEAAGIGRFAWAADFFGWKGRS